MLTLSLGRAIDAPIKVAITIIALLLPATARAQRTPLSNNSQLITAAPSIPKRIGTTGTGLAGHRQRIPKPANGTCPWGWASSGSYCVRVQ
jgi:hypothetical protein